jgi:L-malate glycosyltransferase
MTASTPRLVTGHIDLAREWRGGQRQVFLLTTGLAARGHETHVFTRRGTPLAEQLRGTGVVLHEYRVAGEWDPVAAGRVAAVAKKSGLQLLAAHASHPHGMALATRQFGFTGKIVVHRRVDLPVGRGFLGRRKYAGPDSFIAIGNAVAEVLTQGGVPRGKIRVVSSGVPPHEPVANARARLAAETGLDPHVPWVGDVAGLVEHKGHAHLLSAWRMLMDRGVQAQLVLIGDGPEREMLETETADWKLTESVHFTGWREDVPTWLSALDVFAMTSVTEGLCTAILDAMAARVPVVATAAGGIPELVIDGETGRLARVGDAADIAARLQETLADRERAEQLAERAFTEVWQPRSAEAMVEKTAAVYREIIAS